ncbi:MAG: hypothetical protein WBK44_08280 [Smithellaceae bacterium]|jgi:hypothetical protein|nr:hypothetical protein [Syntrophaceae bacterium]MDX9816649.1 hypothetical protein [Smithellaceae bacterium]NMD04464.1 hypothetical protein [Deltaproteobacteria bacterium]MBP8608703.1 hypothetical protein [Syntrophaceae bacterium]HNV64527.1 hypothetical protein [Smithellaceae bacterium]
MTNIMPEGEDLKKAVQWISAKLEEKKTEPLAILIENAVFKFDLSPKDADFLTRFFGKRNVDK